MGEIDQMRLNLEVDGTFFELIEFSVTRRVRGRLIKGRYGVNVAKVREVVRMPRINPLVSRYQGVAGIFELRGVPIPAVHLATALGDELAEENPKQQLIVAEFSHKRAGFIVDATHRIRRVAWEKVMPPPSDAGSFIAGMTLLDDNEFLFILDLERILISIEYGDEVSSDPRAFGPSTLPSDADQLPLLVAPGASSPQLLLVEDSYFIRGGLKIALEREGYRIVEAENGLEALEILKRAQSGPASRRIDAVVTDVEMPQMDGFSLTRKIRENPQLKALPVLIHSSLSGRTNFQVGENAGANGYIVKNDFQTLFSKLRDILGCDETAKAS